MRSCFARSIAASSAIKSTEPSFAAATSSTCQPYAAYRAETFSVKAT